MRFAGAAEAQLQKIQKTELRQFTMDCHSEVWARTGSMSTDPPSRSSDCSAHPLAHSPLASAAANPSSTHPAATPPPAGWPTRRRQSLPPDPRIWADAILPPSSLPSSSPCSSSWSARAAERSWLPWEASVRWLPREAGWRGCWRRTERGLNNQFLRD